MVEIVAAPVLCSGAEWQLQPGAGMRDLSEKNFGILIAYVLPGFVALSGLSFVSPTVATWLAMPPHDPSVSGACFVFLGSLGAGLMISAIRWVLIDTVHGWTGVSMPEWNFESLQEKLAAFYALVHSHYRYYQFYAGMVIAVPIWIGCRLAGQTWEPKELLWVEAAAAFELVFYLASRDSLKKYHCRASQLLALQDGPMLYLAEAEQVHTGRLRKAR
jgi:hypothetical protein